MDRRFFALIVLAAAVGTSSAAHAQCPSFPVPAVGTTASFGEAIALDEAWLWIGEPDAGLPGRVHVLRRSQVGWQVLLPLTPSDALPGQRFGAALSLDADTAIVGSPRDDELAPSAGSAMIYERSGPLWNEAAELLAPDAAAADLFGRAVAISGDLAVVGAPNTDDGHPDSGSAYVFERQGGTWTFVAELHASDAAAGAHFGRAVDVDGARIVVGAPDHHLGFDGAGAVYVFERVGATWIETAQLSASLVEADANFGASLDLEGDLLLVGEPGRETQLLPDVGAAHWFDGSGGTWVEVAAAWPLVAAGSPRFGQRVALGPDHALIAAPGDDRAGTDAGAVYAAILDGSGWRVVDDTLPLAAPPPGPSVGRSLAISRQQVAIGVYVEGGERRIRLGFAPRGGERSCFCDSLSPCGNPSIGRGCLAWAGAGAGLRACGSTSVASDDLLLWADQLPPSAVSMLFMGSALSPPVPLGNGLRCASAGTQGVFRFPTITASSDGYAGWSGLVLLSELLFEPPGRIQAGDTRYFQVWYRDPFGPCGGASNVTNAVRADFTP